MKKILILSVLAITCFSCKKTYQCECKRWTNGMETVTNVAIEETRKKDAETQCKSMSFSSGWNDNQNCELR